MLKVIKLKYLVLVILTVVACKKEKNTTTTSNYSQVGLPYSGGVYANGSVNFNEYPYSDPNAKIEVKYIDSFKIGIKINSTLNLPSYFKDFTANLKNVIGETKESGNYVGYIMDKDSIQGGSVTLLMWKLTDKVTCTLTFNLVSKNAKKTLLIQSFTRLNN